MKDMKQGETERVDKEKTEELLLFCSDKTVRIAKRSRLET